MTRSPVQSRSTAPEKSFFAEIVQWQNTAFVKRERGFDSHLRLQRKVARCAFYILCYSRPCTPPGYARDPIGQISPGDSKPEVSTRPLVLSVSRSAPSPGILAAFFMTYFTYERSELVK
jgi:hypothetical protein